MVKYSTERVFAALGNSVRRDMVELLAKQGAAPLTVLAQSSDISLPAALKHAGILEDGGIIVSQKVGRTRVYRLNAKALEESISWLTQLERVWDARFDKFAERLKNSQ